MQQAQYGILAAVKSKPTVKTGRKSSIGTTAVQMYAADYPLENGVQILAASGNAGTVYVGVSDQITTDAADATDGFPLAAGAAMFMPIDNLNKVWLKGSAGTQKVFFHGA